MNNESRIKVTLHDTSNKRFYGLIGRFNCVSLSITNKSFRVFDGEHWYEFKTNKKLFLHLNKWEFVRVNDILYIEKDGKKSNIITESQNYISNKN